MKEKVETEGWKHKKAAHVVAPRKKTRGIQRDREIKGVSGKGIALRVSLTSIPSAADKEQQAKLKPNVSVHMWHVLWRQEKYA